MNKTFSSRCHDAAIFGNDDGVFVLGDERAGDIRKHRVTVKYAGSDKGRKCNVQFSFPEPPACKMADFYDL